MTACVNCGGEVRPDGRFCPHCGASQDTACPSCGAATEPGDRFCAGCGASLTAGEAATSPAGAATATPSQATVPETEVRVVSIVFVDLVGFTGVAEGRDPERVRELLDAYFTRARRVVERYGGTVEKFIGDAVMAVWGTPVAHDDDAERAVRAALELVDAVAGLGEDGSMPGVRARGGVVTGRVAATVGATGQGMVAGDRVNTAARIQSVAPPGGVLVDEATRRATATAIAYEDAGSHEVKGKDEVVRTWRAARVIARRGGAVRAQGLEPPFVGREREFRLVREVFETVAEQGSAAMISVVGQPGIGKSRLAWEFEKHLDGLVQTVFWHRGRCLAYGDGVAYNALAEMVRGRADIVEDEDATTARRKLENAVDGHVEDPEERAFVLPRLAQLLGLEERTAPDQADLFAGWRLFFERLAERHPVVLVFEDLQWADDGLLDFIEHLLDWSRDRPILVLTLARPELSDRVDWAGSIRNLTTLHLEPLSDEAMDALLAGLVPGLPEEFRLRIAGQAEGVPLYAVETVRMLLDRGQVVPGDDGYELSGEVDELEVPETLQTLVAARLDGLDAAVRDLLQHAAVLGQSFTRDGVAALSGLDATAVDEGLHTLRAKDLVGLDAGTRGPEEGRYSFLQSMVRTVAYETLSRHERKARHLAAARHLESLPGADELAEVIATHYLDAYRAAEDADDAGAIREDALRMLRRAADRAEGLAAVEEGARCWTTIVELTDEPAARAEGLLRVGELSRRAGREDEARDRLREAAAIFAELGDARQEALAEATMARIDFDEGRGAEAVERLEAAVSRLDPDVNPVEFARLANELARQLYFLGRVDEAAERVDAALAPAERERLVEVVCDALNTKALVVWHDGRSEEALALMRHAYALSDRAPLYVAHRAANNLLVFLTFRAEWEEALEVAEAALRRIRRHGDRSGEAILLTRLSEGLHFTGRWDEAAARLDEAAEAAEAGETSRLAQYFIDTSRMFLHLHRGDLEEARRLIDAHVTAGFADEQERLMFTLGRMMLMNRLGNHRAAIDAAMEVSEAPTTQATLAARLEDGIVSALAVGDLDAADVLRARMGELAEPADELGRIGMLISDARIAAARDRPDAGDAFLAAIAGYEDLGMPVDRAVAQLDLAGWYLDRERPEDAQPLLDEAEATFTGVGARLELERLAGMRERVEPQRAVT